jgi:hypothetical protein
VTTRSPPRFPFNGWPVQWWHESVGYAWFVEPGVFISQLAVERATVEVAERIQDAFDAVLAVEGERLRAIGGIAVIHDWRSMQSHEPRARRAFTDRMRRRPKGYLKEAVLCIHLNPLTRLAVEVSNLVVAVVSPGARLRVVNDPEPELERLGVRVPAPGTRFPEPR